jgi:histidinol dehydrogenase
MRILKLTANTEKRLLSAREVRDEEAARIAARIVGDVRRGGDAALFAWTKKLDHISLSAASLWIGRKEMRAAGRRVSGKFIAAIKHAARNVRAIAERQVPREWSIETERGVRVRQLVRPLESVGCYIPGGRNSLVSTLVMTVVPAQVAGVGRIVVVCPRASDEILAAANLLGIERVGRIGGAQAVAALAYGTRSVARVDKIVGPGNRFVTAAKQLVSQDCAIDLPAGPTEAVVLADRGNPKWIAADLVAQAEHAPDAASFLVTTSLKFAREVKAEIELQIRGLSADSPATLSIRETGAILVARSRQAAIDFVNRFAPEHLSLPGDDGALLKNKVKAAGTVFTGPLAAQALGDYATGSNHVLPTRGWARARGGLSAADFVRCITVQSVNRVGYERLSGDVELLATAEGLPGHAAAVAVRR